MIIYQVDWQDSKADLYLHIVEILEIFFKLLDIDHFMKIIILIKFNFQPCDLFKHKLTLIHEDLLK